ncbi:hypothetical protein SprV_0802642100 [Sparganum proliferum]
MTASCTHLHPKRIVRSSEHIVRLIVTSNPSRHFIIHNTDLSKPLSPRNSYAADQHYECYHSAPLSDYDHAVSLPDYDHAVSLPDHDHAVSLPDHDHAVSLPNHDHAVSLPDHDHAVSLPNHDHAVSLPDYETTVSMSHYETTVSFPNNGQSLPTCCKMSHQGVQKNRARKKTCQPSTESV